MGGQDVHFDALLGQRERELLDVAGDAADEAGRIFPAQHQHAARGHVIRSRLRACRHELHHRFPVRCHWPQRGHFFQPSCLRKAETRVREPKALRAFSRSSGSSMWALACAMSRASASESERSLGLRGPAGAGSWRRRKPERKCNSVINPLPNTDSNLARYSTRRNCNSCAHAGVSVAMISGLRGGFRDGCGRPRPGRRS